MQYPELSFRQKAQYVFRTGSPFLTRGIRSMVESDHTGSPITSTGIYPCPDGSSGYRGYFLIQRHRSFPDVQAYFGWKFRYTSGFQPGFHCCSGRKMPVSGHSVRGRPGPFPLLCRVLHDFRP